MKNNKLTIKERLINSLSFASTFFDNFYRAGFIMLLVINTFSSIIFFVYLGGQNYDTELYRIALFLVTFISYILMFWVVSLCLSIIFKAISDILVKKQEINIINKLRSENNGRLKRTI